MIYTQLTKKAMLLSFEAHKDQADKSGMPYIFHPIHLAEQMADEIAVCTALLHDVAEDTSTTFEQLIEQGFPNDVVDALRLLTHEDAVPYMDYVRRIKSSGNATAIAVKLADLRHNSDITRLSIVDEKVHLRLAKYRAAIEILEA